MLILFGTYKGTVRSSGFHWANPFYSRSRGHRAQQGAGRAEGRAARIVPAVAAPADLGCNALSTKLSLRAHNFNSDALKVNDKRGNPVEIARRGGLARREHRPGACSTWRTTRATCEVQSESAMRSIASRYAYDHGEEHEITLRGGADEVAQALHEELQSGWPRPASWSRRRA